MQIVQQPALRGAEVFAKQLSRALRARAHYTRTIYLYPSRSSELVPEPGDVVLGASPRHPLERVLVQPRVVARALGALDEFRPDIVQLNGGRALKYGAAMRHLRRGARWASIYRNIGDPEYWIRGGAKRLAYRIGVFSGVDGIVALDERAASVFRAKFGVRVPVEVIPTGVSPDDLVPSESRASVRARLKAPEGSVVVLYVGNLAPEKRLDRLISAFAAARESVESHLWLVGDGPERDRLEAMARELRLDARVSFVGRTTDVASYYAAADVFALTSDSEGIPGVLLEAAYFGLPIVATDVGLIRSAVSDGESALVVPADVDRVSDSLGRLLRDSGLRNRLGACGRELVSRQFLMADVASRYEAFYRRVLALRMRG